MNRERPIKVLLVEDQQLIRRGLAMLLATSTGVEVVAQAEDGQKALDMLTMTDADVVLTDARMPRMDGIELAEHCTREYPTLPVLVLTTFDDDALVQAVIASGASGFLLKDTSVEELTRALHAAIGGGMVIDPRVARAAVQPKTTKDEPLAILTRSERVVAELVARGLTNSEIATHLVLAEGTVKNHVSALLRKLDERDRTSLALTLYKTLSD
ncbi:response regulator transcription factor [Devriesea agamarum]|uniref:response regulator transcription factor n=1 Tax=Devriesea agamarum TaxID=472569 RepID=UPI00071E28D3|nr:response regulator transcription factor [Devriesea agamarum]